MDPNNLPPLNKPPRPNIPQWSNAITPPRLQRPAIFRLEYGVEPPDNANEIAWKFGYLRPDGPLHKPEKSGLTPVTPITNPWNSYYAREEKRYTLLREWAQIQSLQGFTTRELLDVGALPPWHNAAEGKAPVQPGGLQCPIHPFLARDRWVDSEWAHHPPFPLGRGRPGDWTASNDIVWRQLEPSLQIATKMLLNMHTVPFWLGLVNRNLTDFDMPGLAAPEPAPGTFRATPQILHPHNTNSTLEEFQRFLDEAGDQMQFSISSGCVNNFGHAWANGIFCYGVCYPEADLSHQSRQGRKLNVRLSFEMLEPLLWDRSDAERLPMQWNIAFVLLHELAHAFWQLRQPYRGTFPGGLLYLDGLPEPFFENDRGADPIAELGNAMESALFGGLCRPAGVFGETVEGRHDVASLAYYCHDWPHERAYRDGRAANSRDVLYHPQAEELLMDGREKWYPIHIPYFEQVQLENFWQDYADVFTATTLRYTRSIGRMHVPQATVDTPLHLAQKLTLSLRGTSDEVHSDVTDDEAAELRQRLTQKRAQMEHLLSYASVEEAYPVLANKTLAIFPFHKHDDSDYSYPFYELIQSTYSILPDQVPDCPRFNIIDTFVYQNRFALGLETLDHFQEYTNNRPTGMPENMLYRWVTQLPGAPAHLTPEEFRAFLRQSSGLRFAPEGAGMVYLREISPAAIERAHAPIAHNIDGEMTAMLQVLYAMMAVVSRVSRGACSVPAAQDLDIRMLQQDFDRYYYTANIEPLLRVYQNDPNISDADYNVRKTARLQSYQTSFYTTRFREMLAIAADEK